MKRVRYREATNIRVHRQKSFFSPGICSPLVLVKIKEPEDMGRNELRQDHVGWGRPDTSGAHVRFCHMRISETYICIRKYTKVVKTFKDNRKHE
jgi:hypothetical protein